MATIKKYEGKKGTSWQVRVRKKGKLHSATFPFKKLAQEWALKMEHEIIETHHFPEHKKPINHTVGELIDLYLERMLPQKAPLTQIKHRHILEWWKKNIGDVALKHVTPILLDEYKFSLLNKPFDPQTVNSYLNALSPAFTWALSPTMQWLVTNPFQHVKRLKEKPGPAPMLTPEETQRLFALCDASASLHLGFFVRMTIGTGGRLQEVLHLKWNHINLRRKTVTFVKTKNYEQRTVPLATGLVTLLEQKYRKTFPGEGAARRPEDTYLFYRPSDPEKPMTNIHHAYMHVRKTCGIPAIRSLNVHGLRHCFASNMAMAGADLGLIADLLGHKSLRMTLRYKHVTERHTASLVEKMGDMLF